MKSLDDQVAAPSDDSVLEPHPAAPPTQPARPAPPRRRRRVRAGVIISGILVAVVTGVIHLVIIGVQNSADGNVAIAKLEPTSKYNAPLSAAVARQRTQVTEATTTLNQARYLITTKDYFLLSSALVDTSTDVSEYDGDLLGKVTKAQYEDALTTLAKSGAALKAAEAVVVADMKATPSPVPTG